MTRDAVAAAAAAATCACDLTLNAGLLFAQRHPNAIRGLTARHFGVRVAAMLGDDLTHAPVRVMRGRFSWSAGGDN